MHVKFSAARRILVLQGQSCIRVRSNMVHVPTWPSNSRLTVKFLSRGLGGFTEEDTRRWPRLGMFCFLMGSAQVFFNPNFKRWCQFVGTIDALPNACPSFLARYCQSLMHCLTKTTRLASIFLSPEALHRPRAPKIIFRYLYLRVVCRAFLHPSRTEDRYQHVFV